MKGSNSKLRTVRQEVKRHERQRADREWTAYHLCVGGHKLRRKKREEEEEGSKIKRGSKKEGGERRDLGQRVK